MPRVKLELENLTHWSTRDLRRFFVAGLRHMKVFRPRKVVVKYSRNGDVTGQAACPGWWIQVNLPGPKYAQPSSRKRDLEALARRFTPLRPGLLGDGSLNIERVAQVFMHEVQHTWGWKHGDMPDWWKLRPAWQKKLRVEWKPPVKQRMAALDRAAERAEHAAEMLKRAETRLKRAKTLRDKWAKKVRYYQRKERA